MDEWEIAWWAVSKLHVGGISKQNAKKGYELRKINFVECEPFFG